jgi:hypothetical protein
MTLLSVINRPETAVEEEIEYSDFSGHKPQATHRHYSIEDSKLNWQNVEF